MTIKLSNDWSELLEEELRLPYMAELLAMLEEKYETLTVYPDKSNIFNALHYTSYEQTKVVILGQDPYHGPQQAHGLSFSVQPGIKVPPSLKNIYKELEADIGAQMPDHGSLEAWAHQGVLLLNTVLTVEKSRPGSHQGIGWERFTDAIIAALNERDKPVVFMLWGKHAEAKAAAINTDKHFIISSPHPSPFAARKGFFGSRPFSRANEFLEEIGSKPIDWSIPKLAELEMK
ncbi:uracil-DNA glycosylase [Paenibacillus sp. FSL H8-0548]|uniref:uracil-DNA glycosylase n=1 Tax=Paenibacillus sp. FSL H8-0548 TaxID=1920422 RepID=UPI00096D7177|nr:uracil-DNA glycosylase [Paenibacillus sp. FSL H8-0548]OMF22738.1 uracil-DNA glycosylase [Paenibacillus sp. FSL H8-0548]